MNARFVGRLALKLACGLLPALSLAQETVELECVTEAARAELPPVSLDETLAEALNQAGMCLADQDVECAETAIDGLRARDLSGDGPAALTILQGDIEAMDGSDRRARRAYRQTLEMEPLHVSLQRQAIERQVVLFLRDEDPRNALEQFEDVECAALTPRLLYLRAVAEYGAGFYQASIDSVENGIRANRALELDVPNAWTSQNRTSRAAFEREGAEADNQLICTEQQTLGSLIPKRTCETAEERRIRQQVEGEREQFEIERGLGFEF